MARSHRLPMLARVARGFKKAVVASGLPRAHPLRLKLKDFVGSVERLAWAKENGCPWDERTSAAVAKGGHLEALRWAREHDCPWNEWTCLNAAMHGHLAVLTWAREHLCPWDEEKVVPPPLRAGTWKC